MTAQLELFGTQPAAAHVDALVCLRDAMSDALEVIVELRNPRPTDSRSPRAAGDWAFCVSNAGLRYQRATEWWGWGAWDRAPRHLLTWDDLSRLVGDDPRRAEVAAWVESLPMPRWQWLSRPHELGPDPAGWHPSYFCRDHVDDQWPARLRAWRLVLELLDDAIAGRQPTPAGERP
ncbi:hypothetical protein Psed_5768 [Pseudonocardia dioxanivorans CB1190]|uniref:Uncharacterized protein n=1 Tax=Pseudonocardia dioxanivorans (strain ATCC 55486 / DSM 44775 / JCM 13855 / CB1190) TaxID=675635 RepID=F4D1A7_PSEUX|nr:hypothetical protein [Pseudonocardia dioxanivorans]AEA27895.1 hypothetical protein Psed_5768 [Pseudonocardia dioxanivorans CB1190]